MDTGAGRSLLRGALASVAGVMAMDAFFGVMRRVGSERPQDEDEQQSDHGGRRLDDISVVGRKARKGEPATQALGRLAYGAVKHEEPPDPTRRRLGKAVHWGYGMLVGGLYGVMDQQWRSTRRGNDGLAFLGEGAGYGTALWLIGDELAVPLLGLAKGPTAVPVRTHAEALGAHLAYGVATATAAEALRRVL